MPPTLPIHPRGERNDRSRRTLWATRRQPLKPGATHETDALVTPSSFPALAHKTVGNTPVLETKTCAAQSTKTLQLTTKGPYYRSTPAKAVLVILAAAACKHDRKAARSRNIMNVAYKPTPLFYLTLQGAHTKPMYVIPRSNTTLDALRYKQRFDTSPQRARWRSLPRDTPDTY